MCQFSIELVFPFPEFEWCVSNYSKFERVIMNSNGSKVSCHINSQSIRETLSIPESNEDMIKQFSELLCLEPVRGLGQTQLHSFISKMTKPNVTIEGLTFPCENSIFQDPLQSLFSLMSRILGLDDDRLIYEVMVGCLLEVSSPKDLNALILMSVWLRKFTLNWKTST